MLIGWPVASRTFHHNSPQHQFFFVCNHNFYRHQGEFGLFQKPITKSVFPRKGGMNCVLGQQIAEFTVVCIGRSTSDNIAWIDIFN